MSEFDNFKAWMNEQEEPISLSEGQMMLAYGWLEGEPMKPLTKIVPKTARVRVLSLVNRYRLRDWPRR